jgi:biotin carboxylase
MTKSNVFVVGLDEFNRAKLEATAEETGCTFQPLLGIDEVIPERDYPLAEKLAKAISIVEASPGGADAIIGYWDFPVSLMVPLLAEHFGLRAPRFDAVMRCEHKYWSRLVQRRVAPEHVPAFEAVDPFDDASVAGIGVAPPYWLKPVKSFGSHLGFRIGNEDQLRAAITAIRGGIGDIGEPFNDFLARVQLPDEVASVDGLHCISEAMIGGRQCTLEGFVHQGQPRIYGVVDSIRYPNQSTFARYQYPSQLPRAVVDRMATIAERVIREIGLDDTPFNIEFFWRERNNQLWLLEINPRISQSHGDLFEKVDGIPHHRIAIDLALGRRPQWHHGSGPFRHAGKFFLRHFEDAVVKRVPSAAEIATVSERIPGTLVEILAHEGMRLSELSAQDQDSYSYTYAVLFIGADNRQQLLQRYQQCLELLPFEFGEVPANAATAAVEVI